MLSLFKVKSVESHCLTQGDHNPPRDYNACVHVIHIGWSALVLWFIQESYYLNTCFIWIALKWYTRYCDEEQPLFFLAKIWRHNWRTNEHNCFTESQTCSKSIRGKIGLMPKKRFLGHLDQKHSSSICHIPIWWCNFFGAASYFAPKCCKYTAATRLPQNKPVAVCKPNCQGELPASQPLSCARHRDDRFRPPPPQLHPPPLPPPPCRRVGSIKPN